jgi:hypothetical protein
MQVSIVGRQCNVNVICYKKGLGDIEFKKYKIEQVIEAD